MDMVNRNLWCWIFATTLGFVICDMKLDEQCKFKQFDGTCQLLTSCKLAMEVLKIKDFQILRSMFCGFHETTPMVCCPKADKTSEKSTTTKVMRSTTVPYAEKEVIQPQQLVTQKPSNIPETSVLPDRNTCGPINNDDKIIGGRITEIDEFPWLARIKFYNPTKDTELYACAGSLISDRFVITAAHCAGIYKIVSVRLGEWDTDTEIDCQDDICNNVPVDIKVDQIIVHPGFNRKNLFNFDIALLRLESSVNFTDFIQPVCLPTTKYIAKQDYIDSTYITAGWGITEFGTQSILKRKVSLDSVPYQTCRAAIPNLPDISPPKVICAGGKKGEDTCMGDSGGPLVRIAGENYEQNWFLFGITSYGVRNCGSAGKPGVYTRVSPYMDWILKTITENN